MLFYDQFVRWDPKSTSPQLYAKCPLHNDSQASFTVNESTGEWYCHGCAMGGKEPQFIAAYYNVGKKVASDAWEQYEMRGTLPFPTHEYVEKCHQNLLERPREMSVLASWGITETIIDEFSLGWEDTRIIFPIASPSGVWVNARRYLPPHRRLDIGKADKKMLNMSKCGENRFYPYKAFNDPDHRPIIIVEGEKDMLAARGQGYNAVTGTAGSSVPVQELALFQGKQVYIMTDTDFVGRKLARTYETALRTMGLNPKFIVLPSKDYADFFKEYGAKDIFEYVVSEQVSTASTEMEKTILSKSEEIDRLNSWLLLENMSIVGTDPKTYSIPCKLRPVCKDMNCQKACPAQSGISMEIDVEPRNLIQFIDSSDEAQSKYVQRIFGCSKLMAEPLEYTNAQRLLFQESAAFVDGIEDASFEPRFGVYLYSSERLTPTQRYNFECIRVAEPRTQQNYYVIREALRIATDRFLNEGVEDDFMGYFRQAASSCNSLMELLEKHYITWKSSLNIEGRVDLFGALMLTYLSVTEIEWRGGFLKGWLDTMVIGDTRTGKSQMAQRLVKTLHMGGYINGENARATGVIGGVQQMGGSWIITWGAIPMNDRGLLIIDEASGLSIEDIKDLSATRSSGAVTINKIAKGEARARTRLIWMSNPRSGRNLEEFFWRGYGAFTEFIPVAEDQARFDILLTAAREDVPILAGYADDGPKPPLDYWKDLINFAWTVPAENIIYTQALAKYIAERVRVLDEIYGGGPLFVGVAAHEKVIRLTCAIAVLCGAVVGNKLMLDIQHVDYAIEFLCSCYDKPSLDYKGFITEYKKAQRKREENTVYIRGVVALYPAMRILLSSNMFRGNQVREILGVHGDESSKVISELLQRGLLKITGSGAYTPDKLLVEITKQMEVQ